MKNVNLLLAGADRRLSNTIEVQIRDVCYEQAVVNCTRILGLHEFARQGSWMGLDLMVVTPQELLKTESSFGYRASKSSVLEAISNISLRHSTPIIAHGVSAMDAEEFREAGVSMVLSQPLNTEELRTAVSEALGIHALVQTVSGGQSSFAGAFEGLLRGFQRLRTVN